LIVNGMSESGNFLGRIVLSEHRRARQNSSVSRRHSIAPASIRSGGGGFPFFWAWAPGDYPLETGFAWLLNDAEPAVSPDHRSADAGNGGIA
jgi:hypothetical protein